MLICIGPLGDTVTSHKKRRAPAVVKVSSFGKASYKTITLCHNIFKLNETVTLLAGPIKN